MKLLRRGELYRYKSAHSKNPVWKGLYWINSTKKNRLGVWIGVEILENLFAERLIIHHSGSNVVNGNSKVEKNCQLH